MRDITIIYDGTLYTYKWIKTLFWAKSIFRKEGIKINYINMKSFFPVANIASHQIDEILRIIRVKKLDIVAIAYHHSISDFSNGMNLDKIAFLKFLKENCNKVVWLDTADSTGNCQFEVLPFVDVYLKKQILKDLKIYTKKLYGTKQYTDYYHRKQHLDDPQIDKEYELLKPEYIGKLKVSWNIGLSDFWSKSRYCLSRFHNISFPRLTPINKERNSLLFFNGTMNYSPLNGFQRRKTIELIESMNEIRNPAPTQKMSHEEYVYNMQNTKAAISPFGWGEICYRDFEAFVYGATLLKPDMSGISTYPDFFVAGETYVPIKWDFSDFNEVYQGIESDNYRKIAEYAQEKYESYIRGDFAKQQFVNHFLTSIGI